MVSESASSINAGPNKAKFISETTKIEELESEIARCNEGYAAEANSHKQCQTDLEAEKCRYEREKAHWIAETKDRNQTRHRPLSAEETNIRAPTPSASASASSSSPSVPLVSPRARKDYPEANRSSSPIIASSNRGAKSKEGKEKQSLDKELRLADEGCGSDMDYSEAYSTDSEMHESSDDMPETTDSGTHVPGRGTQEELTMDIDTFEFLKSSLSRRKPTGSKTHRSAANKHIRLAKTPLHPASKLSRLDALEKKRTRRKPKRHIEQVQLPDTTLNSQRTGVD
jgi:hypothetical protein